MLYSILPVRQVDHRSRGELCDVSRAPLRSMMRSDGIIRMPFLYVALRIITQTGKTKEAPTFNPNKQPDDSRLRARLCNGNVFRPYYTMHMIVLGGEEPGIDAFCVPTRKAPRYLC
jgi:hypothetical protein